MRVLAATARRPALPPQARLAALPDGGVAFSMLLPPGDGPELLARTARLPGNARVARGVLDGATAGDVTVLLAELVAGDDVQARALALIEACGRGGDAEPTPCAGREQAAIRALLHEARLPTDAIVARDGGCEVRVATGDVVRPVLVVADGDGLRIEHRIVAALAGAAEPAADHALRCNARIRHARLARDGARLRAEARLAAPHVTPQGVARAVRAVAALATHAAFALHLLSEDGSVRAQYAQIVLGQQPRVLPDPDPTPERTEQP